MTFSGAPAGLLPAADSITVDPFGLWLPPAAGAADSLSFEVSGAQPSTGAPGTPAAVWTLDLGEGPVIEQRAGQVRAIEAALDSAGPRAEALLAALALSGSGASFATEASEGASVVRQDLPLPEAGLAFALAALDPSQPASGVSFGLPEELARIDWQDLYRRLSGLFENVNRQFLHYAWVDTTLDGRLLARTTVNWSGGFLAIWSTDLWQAGLPTDQVAAHCRSLDLALASRLSSLRAILTVSEIAGKIAFAVATPLGPLQALALAWQFVSAVMGQSVKQSISD